MRLIQNSKATVSIIVIKYLETKNGLHKNLKSFYSKHNQ